MTATVKMRLRTNQVAMVTLNLANISRAIPATMPASMMTRMNIVVVSQVSRTQTSAHRMMTAAKLPTDATMRARYVFPVNEPTKTVAAARIVMTNTMRRPEGNSL